MNEEHSLNTQRSVWKDVKSSVIRRYLYVRPSRKLYVELVNDLMYCYWQVPPQVVNTVFTADSVGTMYNALIKPTYHYQRVH